MKIGIAALAALSISSAAFAGSTDNPFGRDSAVLSLAGLDLATFEWKTIPQGAATSVWTGVVADADEVGGRYCENCHVTTNVTNDEIGAVAEGVRPYALDPERAKALWARSEQMVGERFPAKIEEVAAL